MGAVHSIFACIGGSCERNLDEITENKAVTDEHDHDHDDHPASAKGSSTAFQHHEQAAQPHRDTPSSIYSPITSASASFDDNTSEASWTLHLPIFGAIALRRAHQRAADPFQIQREQMSQLHHEIAEKTGPLRDTDVVFREVDWTGEGKGGGRDGEDMSPKSKLPTRGVTEQSDLGEEQAEEMMSSRNDEERGGSFDLLDYTIVPRFSAPFEEGDFLIDPFKGHPWSAPGRLEGEKG
ncbi:hypothetical protein BDY17DRAFT_136612 [Neohortaea acidophila]|uniref:Uncharacterized protein n=1 Tax=Neohortaea acidophila TaxID=245834 RepID=A0A6A6PUG9_9PEZI|nr:uncharacterized protein BDY17DRAFT_136612 [Neohortaea acidophila]KAF2482867.1 hypothetical protein BDY17DRAFT_136612 [Neohortaea acidophila]